MKVTRTKKLIAIAFIIVLLMLIAGLLYKINVYPYEFSKNFYTENKTELNQIVTYFKSYDNIDSIRYAKIDIDGNIEIVSNRVKYPESDSDTGYQILSALREKYIDDNTQKYNYQLYTLDYTKANL